MNKHKARHVEFMTKTWNVCKIHQPKKNMTVLCVLDYGKSNAVKKETIFFLKHVVNRRRGIMHNKHRRSMENGAGDVCVMTIGLGYESMKNMMNDGNILLIN